MWVPPGRTHGAAGGSSFSPPRITTAPATPRGAGGLPETPSQGQLQSRGDSEVPFRKAQSVIASAAVIGIMTSCPTCSFTAAALSRAGTAAGPCAGRTTTPGVPCGGSATTTPGVPCGGGDGTPAPGVLRSAARAGAAGGGSPGRGGPAERGLQPAPPLPRPAAAPAEEVGAGSPPPPPLPRCAVGRVPAKAARPGAARPRLGGIRPLTRRPLCFARTPGGGRRSGAAGFRSPVSPRPGWEGGGSCSATPSGIGRCPPPAAGRAPR